MSGLRRDEIRNMSDEDLLKAIEDNRYEMFMLRVNQSTGELKNPNLFRQNRRNLARLKTILHERRAAVEKGES
jgi:large subunit ribosomal protein L29